MAKRPPVMPSVFTRNTTLPTLGASRGNLSFTPAEQRRLVAQQVAAQQARDAAVNRFYGQPFRNKQAQVDRAIPHALSGSIAGSLRIQPINAVADTHPTNSPRTPNNHPVQAGNKSKAVKATHDPRHTAMPNWKVFQANPYKAPAIPPSMLLRDSVNPTLPTLDKLHFDNSAYDDFMGRVPGLLRDNQTDPDTYANSILEAKYGPVIAELARQEKMAAARGQQSSADIQGWYQQLVGNMGARGTENSAEAAKALAGITSTAGIANAFGAGDNPDIAGAIGSTAGIAADYQRAINASQGSFDRDLQSVTGLQGVQALTNNQARVAAQLADINSQETDLQKAKGAERRSLIDEIRQQNFSNRTAMAGVYGDLAARSDAHQGALAELGQYNNTLGQQRFENEGTLQANDRARQEFNANQRQQRFTNLSAAKQQQFQNAMAAGNYNMALSLLPIKARTELAQALATERAAKAKKPAVGVTPLSRLTGQDRSQLYAGIRAQVMAEGSGFVTTRPDPNNPGQTLSKKNIPVAVQQVGSALRAAGYNPNTSKQAKDMARQILKGMGINPKDKTFAKWFK